MRGSGHTLENEAPQRLVRADAASDCEGVEPPGANAEVLFFSVDTQLLRLGSLLSVFKKVLQLALISVGMRGFEVDVVTFV